MDLEEIIKLEKRLLESSVRKSAEELNSLLSPGFVEFGTSGRIYNRQIVVEQLAEEVHSKVETLDFEGVFLAPDVVQLRYKTQRDNQDGTVSASLRSSIWKRVHGRWQMFFHQGTPTNS
jgi:hypothetical protein